MNAMIYRKQAAVLVVAVAAGMIAVEPASKGLACGYEDPQSVSRGSLNWSYPNALFVVGAISSEVAARRLPLANFNRSDVDLFGRRFQTASTSLKQFGAMLDEELPLSLQGPVSVVLVEPMLWTRFEPTAEGMRTILHTSGPTSGDTVLVTGEAVVAEIAANRLTLAQALARGVARLYPGRELLATRSVAAQKYGPEK